MSVRKGTVIDPRNWEPENFWFRQGNVIAWFDRHIKLWTVFAIDPVTLNQAGPADYFPNAASLAEYQGAGAFPADTYD